MMIVPRLIAVFLTAVALSGCSAVKVQMGPATDEEASAESEDQARRLRASWANRLQSATARQQVTLVKTLIDSTAANYLRYGERVASTWRDEESRLGGEMPIEEIRRMVENSNRNEYPMFEAYEDIIDHGLELILGSREMPVAVENDLKDYRDHFSEIFSAVFYPNGPLSEFENRLANLRLRAEDISLKLTDALSR